MAGISSRSLPKGLAISYSCPARSWSLYSDPLFCHLKARTTCSSQAPTPPPPTKPSVAGVGGGLQFLPWGTPPLPDPR